MIYPKIQKNELNGNPLNIDSVKISGDFKEIAGFVFNRENIKTDGDFDVSIKITNSRKTTYIEEISRISDEKYFITVSENGAIIETSTAKGVFRAVNTLSKLINKNELKTGKLEDYPLFETRGYIEGFYGPTWSHISRLSVMQLMAKYGMNTYFYAPKDDIYHREKWREKYPQKEWNDLKALFDASAENYLDFNWCVGPGLSYKYTSDEDFDLLIEKFKSIYSMGVRGFGLLLDDIPWDFQYDEDAEKYDGIVDAHIDLVNRTYNALKEFDSNIKLTVCPTQYSGDENGYYVSKFGKGIPSDVKMFWTGEEICSRVLTVRESQELLRATEHRPLFWDNYPVNDCEMFREMHLGALIGRDKELYKACDGLISNVMEYAECSKIPLMTIADYLWNPQAYNPDNSLRNAHYEMLGEKAELFKYFADHLGVSCLSKYSSSLMSETLSKISFLLSKGEIEKGLEVFDEYNKNMRECLEMLQEETVPLFKEMKKWVKKFSMCCDLLDAISNAKKNPSKDNMSVLSELTGKYNSDGTLLTGFCLREMAEKTLNLY
ncbi:MAG: beta-N-acetylglucosaminidase domain-containing protein [Clostridia bacterium]|nr:beta-N-acetylglucosaminidase domain-containing protein [Clostridia bacterium]